MNRDPHDSTMTGEARNPEEMFELGRRAAALMGAGSVIALVGGLGAGKTHWTKGFVAGFGSDAEVTSPTFGLVHEYPTAGPTVYHFDFYRLDSANELMDLGWDEYLESGGVVVAEWADKYPELLPPEAIWLDLEIAGDGLRRVRVRTG